ncbi:hypothetical protein [Fibrobacter sp.]|uniref:hypothetical protein n=1 Tax=Fibrobacter sp. TaxID=35828 RepID=UPI00388E817D
MKKNKEIICVYQDCILCGDKGKKLKKLIFDKNLNVRKVSFASEEGKDLIHTAVFEKGIGGLPFFTDGTKFTKTLDEFIKPKKKGEKDGVAK